MRSTACHAVAPLHSWAAGPHLVPHHTEQRPDAGPASSLSLDTCRGAGTATEWPELGTAVGGQEGFAPQQLYRRMMYLGMGTGKRLVACTHSTAGGAGCCSPVSAANWGLAQASTQASVARLQSRTASCICARLQPTAAAIYEGLASRRV